MRFITFIFLLASLSPAEDFTFIQLSDPQFGMYTENRDFVQETANFEFAIANANRLRPAFVVVCGDLIHKPGDVAQTAEYLRIGKLLDKSIPLYNVAGNHDVGNEPTTESLAIYRRNFGPDYYTFRHGELLGIVLDSSLIQHPEKAPQEAAKQEQWLTEQLRKATEPNVRTVVFQHIPWFLQSADEPDQYFNIPLATRARFLALFEKHNIRHVFAGHYHRNSPASTPSLQMITTGPVGKPLGTETSGLRIVSVKASGIESRYYGLGNLPNR